MSNDKIKALKDTIASVFAGKDSVIEHLLVAVLAGGHVLIEDVPGVGKTTLAKTLAAAVGLSFARVQCTPDTLPSDIIGMNIFDAKTSAFRLVKGPVFQGFLLVDEINRTSPKTQSALLEAMEEGQVTIDGNSYPLPKPNLVVATQNPIEYVGTYPLPEAELDRFMIKMSVGYPEKAAEEELARRFLSGALSKEPAAVLDAEELLAMQEEVRSVSVSDELTGYALSLVDATRHEKEIACGLSPRAGLDLLRASQAWSFMDGRDYVIPEDIIAMAKLTLPHRLILTTEARIANFDGYQMMIRVLDRIKRPE